MATPDDFRDYVNPHPSCSEQAQLSAIGPGGEVYIEDRDGEVIEAVIRSIRKNRRRAVRVMWLFNLAPVHAATRTKRSELIRRINQIHERGGYVLECATGLRSDRDMATMVMKASEMVGNYARGAAGKPKRGRPKMFRDARETAIMKAEWFSRQNETIESVLDVLEIEHDIETNKNEFYRLFGPRLEKRK